MGFAPKYTQTQRRTIARLMLDENRSGPEVVRMVAAGVHGLDPVQIPVGTVYDIADRERKRRQDRADAQLARTPEGKLALAHRRAQELAEKRLRKLQRQDAKGTKFDHAEFHNLTRSLANLIRAQPAPTVPQVPEGKPDEDEEDDFMRRVEERHQADLRRQAEEAKAEEEAGDEAQPHSLRKMLENKSPEGHRRLGAYLREQSYVTEEMADQLMRKHGFDPALAA